MTFWSSFFGNSHFIMSLMPCVLSCLSLRDRARALISLVKVGDGGTVAEFHTALISSVLQNGEMDELRILLTKHPGSPDPQLVLKCVERRAMVLKYATLCFSATINDAICEAAVRQDPNALSFACTKKCRRNPEIVATAVQQNGLLLWYACTQLQNDREIVGAAVRQNGRALRYTSTQLRNDRDIVGAAVRQNGKALRFASTQLRNDREIVAAAVASPPGALKYADMLMRDDLEIVPQHFRHMWPCIGVACNVDESVQYLLASQAVLYTL